MENKKNYFEVLNDVNVNEWTEKKNGLTYLSWAYAWGELKKRHPKAQYVIYENNEGWNYFTDGKTAWVKTGVVVDELEHIEYLPVMDFRNNSIPLDKITSFDVNKAIQRSLTKAVARHGLGLYVYAGEDLPEEERELAKERALENKMTPKQKEVINNLDDDKKKVVLDAYGTLDLTIEQANKVIKSLRNKGLLNE